MPKIPRSVAPSHSPRPPMSSALRNGIAPEPTVDDHAFAASLPPIAKAIKEPTTMPEPSKTNEPRGEGNTSLYAAHVRPLDLNAQSCTPWAQAMMVADPVVAI